jgi:sulfur carrier protein ThiS
LTDTATLVHSPHPFSPTLERKHIAVPVVGNPTIAEVLQAQEIRYDLNPMVVQVNGNPYARETWDTVKVAQGDLITVRQGVAGKASPIIAILAEIVLMIVTYGAFGWQGLGASLAASTGLSVGVASGIIMIAGNLVIAGITSMVNSQALRGSTGGGASTPSQWAINGVSNNARPMQPIPLVLGTIKMFPDVGSAPFTDFEGTDEYLYSMFNFGMGNLAITGLEIGQTDINSFTGVTTQYSDTNGNITLFPGDVQSAAGGALTYNVPVTRTSEVGVTQLAVDFTGTLFTTNNDGSFGSLSCQISVLYRVTGTSSWQNWMSFDSSIPEELAQSQYEQWQFYQLAGAPDAGDYNAGVQNSLTLSNNTSNPVRSTLVRQVPAGQYDVMVTLQTAPPTNAQSQQSITWTVLKSYVPDTADYSTQTRLAVKIQASGQLNGTIDNLSAMVSNQIPTNPSYDGVTWVTAATSNPAWQYLYFARGGFDKNGNRIFGAGLADSRIDIAGLIEWAQFCDTNTLGCNLILNSSGVVADQLNSIAQCGRGQLSFPGGVLGVVWDEGDLSPVQMFAMPNIRAGSFQVQYISANLADEFVINFNNAALGYQMDSVSALMPGVTVPSNTTQIDIQGITDKDQAGRQANLLAASQFYRCRQVQFETDIEGLVAGKGDVITMSHDLTSWSVGGRLVSGTTESLVLDRQITFTPTSQPWISVRFPDGHIETVQVVEESGTTNTVTLNMPLSASPNADTDNVPMDYLYQFDPTATPGKRFKVLSKQYMGNDANWAQIVCTDDDPAYYAAEYGEYTYIVPNLLNQGPGTVSAVTIHEQLIAANAGNVTIFVNWNIVGAVGTHVRYQLPGQTAWVDAGTVYQPSYSFNVYSGGTVTVELTPVQLAQTAANQGTSVTTSYTITGLNTLPENLAPQMPNVSGLQLQVGTTNGGNADQFFGADAKFVWNAVAASASELGSEPSGADSGGPDTYFKNYYITISNTDGSVRRFESTTSPTYIYTFEKNSEDGSGTPVREFTISVVVQGISNQVSPIPATLTVTNPPPIVPTGITLLGNLTWIGISWDRPADTDYAGVLVYGSTDVTFTPGPANLLLDASVGNSAAIQGLDSGVEYYFYFQPYDLFGKTELNQSSQFNCTTAYVATVDLDPTLTSDIAQIAVNTTAITTEQTVRASADTALASSITSLTAIVGSNTAAITTEATARASGDSSLASSITTLSSTVAGNTAAISTNASAISGIEALYAVKIDINGYVSGYELIGTGSTSSFIVLANEFQVVTPGNTAVSPFTVDGTGTHLTNTTVNGSLIVNGSVAANKLNVLTLDAISADIGTLTDGLITNNSGTNTINLSATGSSYFINTPGLKLTAAGSATFSGALSAATGSFAGSLSAATGTFAGSLSAATGSFAGSLSAATGSFAGDISAATGTFTGALSGASGTFSGTLTASNIVTTSNLQTNSATNAVSNFSATAVTMDTTVNSGTSTLITESITTVGAQVYISFTCQTRITTFVTQHGSASDADITIQIWRDGIGSGTKVYDSGQLTSGGNSGTAYTYPHTPQMCQCTDTPSAGFHTYSVTGDVDAAGFGGHTVAISINNSIFLLETRR